MNKAFKRTGKGFTIIEVVLVLAIASMIFLMVFLAVPALQANTRDTARKDDVSKIVAGLASYASNNSGKLPVGGTAYSTYSSYVGTLSGNTDITKINIVTYVAGATTKAVASDQVDIWKGYRCDPTVTGASGTSATTGVKVGGTNTAAITTKLEAGGGIGFCLDL
jgi:prepilin-type N-terminal cleavage/methylation domain-containing protein